MMLGKSSVYGTPRVANPNLLSEKRYLGRQRNLEPARPQGCVDAAGNHNLSQEKTSNDSTNGGQERETFGPGPNGENLEHQGSQKPDQHHPGPKQGSDRSGEHQPGGGPGLGNAVGRLQVEEEHQNLQDDQQRIDPRKFRDRGPMTRSSQR